ncbi:TEL2-interacting protein 1, partial [Rhizopus stolonifer]
FIDHEKSKASEEIKHWAVQCLSVTLPAKHKEGRYGVTDIYVPLVQSIQQQIPIASHTIMGLLSIIRFEHKLSLRLDAIRVLSQLLLDNLIEVDILAGLLPGVVSKLCAAIRQKSVHEHHSVICDLLTLLTDMIKKVMADDTNPTLVGMQSWQDLIKNKETVEDKTVRNAAWYANTQNNMAPILGQILMPVFYPDWRTRLGFVEFAYSILFHCPRTLNACVKSFTEVLVLHMDDAYEQVSTTCKLRMQVLISNPGFEQAMVPVLKDNLYDWMHLFPHYMISKDEQEKNVAMSLMTGLLILLGDQSESVLSTVLPRISDGWMTALQVDQDCLDALQEHTGQRLIQLQQNTAVYPRIRLKHVVSDVTADRVGRLLNTIGKYCDLSTWVHHFMRYISSESNDPQAAYIVYALFSGAAQQNDDWFVEDTKQLELEAIGLQVMQDMMDMLIKTNTTTRSLTQLHTVDQEIGYIFIVCFSLQTTGFIACLLDQDVLQEQLMTILYPLLAQLGSPNVYIHTYALMTLDNIAYKCGLENTQALAIHNIDYVINMISQHMTVLTQHVRVLLVLKALIHVGGRTSIQYLDDSVQEIYDAFERYGEHEGLSMQLCSVLFEIEEQVSLEVKAFIEQKEQPLSEDKQSMENIGKYFLERQEQGLHDHLTLAETMEQENTQDTPKEDKEPPLTHEQDMVKHIMDKASHFLSASQPQLRSQVLSLLTKGVSVLSDHPQQLNPLIYSMWSSIVYRFEDSQNYVVFAAAQLIEAVAQVSTDFLSSKFERDLWPRFKMILQKGVQAAKSDPTSTGYSVYSLYHRTQHCLMKTLTCIAYDVPMRQWLVKDILQSSQFYYANPQVHEQLSNACSNLHKALATQQPDTVWLYELQQDIVSPSPLLDSGTSLSIQYLGSVIGLDSLSDSLTETTKPKKPSSFDFSLLDSRK